VSSQPVNHLTRHVWRWGLFSLMALSGWPMSSHPAQAAHHTRTAAVVEPAAMDDTYSPRQPGVPSTLQSDDFNSCTLGNQWEFINPQGDGTMVLDGTQLQLTVPAGVSHNVFENGILAPHLVQTVNDVDFEAVAKFTSPVTERFQVQGILVIQDVTPDAEDFIRFDFFHDGNNARIYAAAIQNGTPIPQIDTIITPTSGDLYLKVRREGNLWTESYSFDGVNYTNRNFTLTTPFAVTKVGLFAANHGAFTIPAHTAVVDYFFNTAAPIANEDGKPSTLTLTAAPQAGGTVAITAPLGKTNFACGEQITVAATPASGWRFDRWSGAVAGTANPVTFAYNIGDQVTANFVEGTSQQGLFLPVVSAQ